MSTRDCDCENLGKVNRRGAIRSAVASSMLFSGILQQLAADEGPANREKTGGEKPSGHQQVHFPPKAKRVIFLFMTGGVSHVDTFDPKPALTRDHGKEIKADHPEIKDRPGYERIFLKKPQWEFSKHGESGIEVSTLFPHVAKCVDDIALILRCILPIPITTTRPLGCTRVRSHSLAQASDLG